MPDPIHYRIEGNANGPTLVFIHGWPDNASLWRKQVAALGGRFRCVLLTLPNYGESQEKAGGHDFPELVNRLAATIQQVSPDGPVGLITHDWGAYLGYLLEQAHPDLIDRMASFDVGGHLGRTGFKTSMMIISYQWSLVICWLAGGVIPPLGRLMTRAVARAIRVPSRQRANIRSRYNYLYFYMWRGLLLPWSRLPGAIPLR
jgi:pimeloyl-ACP methyl ester carboxylesterase